jgi:putative aminopeptidase FrvX
MIIDTEQFIFPSDPLVIKQIKDCAQEISASMTRNESEKSFQKDALSALAEATEIPKKYLSKVCRLWHKQNREAVEQEQDSTVELYDKVFGIPQE